MTADGDPGLGEETDGIDLALAAFRERGEWEVADLDVDRCATVTAIAQELRRYPGDDGALAMLSVDEDFFVLVRTRGTTQVSVLLSDASAATDWELARSITTMLGLPVADDDEPDPAGDLGLLADLGLSAVDLGVLIDDEELYPDEQLSEIATRLGFGEEFDELAEFEDA